MAKNDEFIKDKTDKEKKQENQKLDDQLKITMEDNDVDAEVLIPSSEYIDLVSKSKYTHAPMTKKRKILTILGASLGGLGVAGGVTAGVLFAIKPSVAETTEIVFDLNNDKAEWESGGSIANFEVEKTFENCNAPQPVTVADNGYFVGWRDLNGVWLYDLKTVKVKDWVNTVKEKKFVAVWYTIGDIQTLQFNATQQGGYIKSGSDHTYAYKDTYWKDINKPEVEKENALFEGWYDKDGKAMKDTDQITSDATYYAHFSESYDYVLNFHADESKGEYIYGNTKVAAQKEQLFGELNHPNIYKENCILAGWYYLVGERKVMLNDYDAIQGNLDLYPEWYSACLIHYETNGGTIKSGSEYHYAWQGVHFLTEIAHPTIVKDDCEIDYWEKYNETSKQWDKLTNDNDLIESNSLTVRPVWKNAVVQIYVDCPEYADVTKQSDTITVLIAPVTCTQKASYKITKWTPDVEEAEEPEIITISNTEFAVKGKNTGKLELTFYSAILGENGPKTTVSITIKEPYEQSNSFFTYVENKGWGVVTGVCDTTSKIKTTWFDESIAQEEVERVDFNEPIYIGDQITALDDNFLYNCSAFNCNIFSLENKNIETIGNNFMFGCETFDKIIKLPSKLKIIKQNFMYGCKAFNNASTQEQSNILTLSSNIEMIGSSFMYNCNNFVSEINVGSDIDWIPSAYTLATDDSSAGIYTKGIKLTGDGATVFKTQFNESTSSPYRKYKSE